MDPRLTEEPIEAAPAPEPTRPGTMPVVVGGLIVAVALLTFLFSGNRAGNPEVDSTASTRPGIQAPAPSGPAPITTPQRP